MISFSKRGSSSFRRWWWSLDATTIVLLSALFVIGSILITTASPAVADRLKISSFYFAHRQFIFLFLGLGIIIIISALEEKQLKQLVLLSVVACFAMLVLVLLIGDEVKGSRRWIATPLTSLQPSELLKPFYIFICGMLLSERYNRKDFPGFKVCIVMHGFLVALLFLQPDFGMVITYTSVLAGQFFLAGLSLWWIAVVGIVGITCALGAYSFLPHVAKRIDNFLNPENADNYQVEKSLEAYINGGLFGRGPGEGTVKSHLPDSHTDFIFAVAGEEFGAIFSCMIILVFLGLTIRGLYLLSKEENLLRIYTGGGIIMLFALQTIFNIGVTLHLFPTKGMTLPFISYGGSSMFSFAIAFGIFLNLTKKRYEITIPRNRSLIMTR